ncbi:DUF2845 domain-containing protein [Legionella spiritensis]|uniref:DUF2845 domain-containing protein n=1 Tax=Legionella spiritensis TaxID=452 RepID=A0A0W0YX99_LEGSP|nr:DUF2845 domain-containing protein [Legionella spiritensis]KTD61520.1 hypothetical protein Lspi_2150 [Legionella spiritensis]SNV32898.1 Protein of uncharacterised function (DUF2845) [Legionella spiritensis]VEG92309.1 Protein of uncharacterised function (DUF2845) [Legionella spiritensis]
MIKQTLTTLGLATVSLSVFAAQSVYCPQRSGYINVGMTQEQVLNACGQPLSKQESNTPVTEKVPVQQLMYNNQGAPKAFYGVWAIPVGNSNTGFAQPFGSNTGGAQLQVDITDNKVSGVKINGSDANAFSICGGTSIQIGDPASKVYGACGDPSLTNKTFINKPIPSTQKPEVWVYQPGQYQSPVSLTFVNGKLQSID